MYTSLFQIKLCMMYIYEKYQRKDYGKNYKKPLEMCRENVYDRVTDEKNKKGE